MDPVALHFGAPRKRSPMNTPIPRLALATPSARTEALSEASIGELAPVSRSAFSPIGRLSQRVKSDEQLARDLQAGIADALTELFRRHSRALLQATRRIVGSEAEAEDVVQQVFLDVFRAIQQFDPEKASFKTWLFMFGYHRAFNHRRAMVAARIFDSCPLDDSGPIAFPGHSQAEQRVLVEQALGKLPARERRTIELIYFKGLTGAEAAAVTRESVRVVRHNLYRGLEKLRKILIEPEALEQPRKGGSR